MINTDKKIPNNGSHYAGSIEAAGKITYVFKSKTMGKINIFTSCEKSRSKCWIRLEII